MEVKPLTINSYLSFPEIEALLEGVDYIVKAEPSLLKAPELPLHFTIVLNTSDTIPEEVRPLILEKFCRELGITQTSHLLSELQPVAFALTPQETPMPRHLIDPADARTIPWKLLHIIDFLGGSEGFKEAKDGLSGWSYSYN